MTADGQVVWNMKPVLCHRFPLDRAFEALQITAQWASRKSVVVP